MILLIFILLIGTQFIYLGANLYAAARFYKLPHQMGRFVAIAFFANAIQVFFAFVAFAFGPRPDRVVVWTSVLSIIGQIIRVAGALLLNFFLLGWINGVGNYAKKDNNDRTLDNNS